ncbi:EFR1 family ferrodoxin [Candidatus Cetobacterium colombiensis]|uniref:EFR1 family ferrodoxin n=1 Tax=Candidatus Cetobacterium colombiensis TaxID=3073100 RepID=A0ABU4W7U6_9FUSO|nr:EFR1 family ferrodoxin [Candidatus Cetobacterium colombiensis]MDX8335593.1 EFR1 family ferrodoxin [Candidatus Cetobacterium colombiensis]
MKTIYYFSGTGNSLYLGKILKKNCSYNLVNLSAVIDEEVILEGDIGIIFPIYAMGIPKIVEEFLKKVKIGKIDYFFAVATCGGSGYGIPFNQIKNILNEKNIKLDYTNYCHMPDNYLKLFKPLSTEEAKKDINSSKEKIDVISKHILNKKSFITKEKVFLYLGFLLIYKFWRYGLKKVSKSFKLNEKRCISCGICMEVCPVNNIDLVEGKPIWNNNCEECLACANLCPTIAISCGGKSKYDLRYKNPYIDIKELKNNLKGRKNDKV